MNFEIRKQHEFLNDIYNKAEIFLKKLQNNNIKATLNSYNKHYIKINDKYELQRYFMPVISIENKGDICFNLDGLSLEFFLSKDKLILNDNLLDIVEKYNYNLEIYSNENCLNDLYFKGISLEKLKENIISCNDDIIGITINCQNLIDEKIIDCFNNVCKLLKI